SRRRHTRSRRDWSSDVCSSDLTILPNYDVPKEYPTHYDLLKKLCDDGLKQRYGENPSEEILKRAEYEIGIIKKMGYVDYYLIVRSEERRVGTGASRRRSMEGDK